jgi:hypothetical protein
MPTTSRRDVILSAAVARGGVGPRQKVAPEESQQTRAAPMPSPHKPMAPKTPDPGPGFL